MKPTTAEKPVIKNDKPDPPKPIEDGDVDILPLSLKEDEPESSPLPTPTPDPGKMCHACFIGTYDSHWKQGVKDITHCTIYAKTKKPPSNIRRIQQ